MKKVLCVALVFMASCLTATAQKEANKQLLRHVVLFGWNENTDPAYINKVVVALSDLQYKIPVIKSFEWGTNNSPENLNNGLTHCFTLTFTSEADRDAYLVDPAHKAFVALLSPAPDKVTVVDYWATN
jgi:hypothetical protein